MKKELIRTERYIHIFDEAGKQLAHLPLNDSPILEGVPLLPSLEVEDSNKDLFYQKQVMNPYPTGAQSYASYEKGFIDGYNKAKEKYKFTEEHAKYLFECGRNFQINADITFTVAREHLLQLKSPTYFEFETEITHEGNGTYSTDLMDIGLSNLTPIKVIKTTTNSQGQEVACGKYIY